MKTIDWATLEMLVGNREPLELLDVRPKTDFAAVHIRGARSFPIRQFAKPRLARPKIHASRVYVVADDTASGGVAAGILRANGWTDPVVVHGGMRACLAHGVPVRTGLFAGDNRRLLLPSAIFGVTAPLAFLLHEPVIGCLLIGNAALLLIKQIRSLPLRLARGLAS